VCSTPCGRTIRHPIRIAGSSGANPVASGPTASPERRACPADGGRCPCGSRCFFLGEQGALVGDRGPGRLLRDVHGICAVAVAAFQRIVGLEARPFMCRQLEPVIPKFLAGVEGRKSRPSRPRGRASRPRSGTGTQKSPCACGTLLRAVEESFSRTTELLLRRQRRLAH
jgi:hypothetical protein